MLTREQVAQFQTLYKNRFGKEIGYEEAYEKGVQLVLLMRRVYKPLPKKRDDEVDTTP